MTIKTPLALIRHARSERKIKERMAKLAETTNPDPKAHA